MRLGRSVRLQIIAALVVAYTAGDISPFHLRPSATLAPREDEQAHEGIEDKDSSVQADRMHYRTERIH
jgi:hypothetical protein